MVIQSSLIKFNLENERSPLQLVIIIDKKIRKEIIMFGNVSSGLFDFKHLYVVEILNSEISSSDRYAFKCIHSF
jgi:hypothetical protein